MSWYKKAQSFNLEQRPALLVREYADETLFPSANEAIRRLKVEDLLKEFSESKKYNTAMDYLFCSLYPAYERSCRRYYEEGKYQLGDMLTPIQLSFVDKILTGALETLGKKRDEMLTAPAQP